MAETTSSSILQTPLLDPQTGKVAWAWLKVLQQWHRQIQGGLSASGTIIGNLEPTVAVAGRPGTVGSILGNITRGGVVLSHGMTSATSSFQGAVVVPVGAVSNVLGTAAIQSATAFDASGSATAAQAAAEIYAAAQASTAQTNAETYAAGQAAAAQSNAEAFSSNAANLTSGIIPSARYGGLSAVITTAKLTTGGANGSMTFTNGLLVSEVAAT